MSERTHASSPPPSASEMVERLGLTPHPEGGHYRETWRGAGRGDGRAVGTAIVFLLAAGERSHWHRVDADEVWLHHDGDPLVLAVAGEAGALDELRLGSPLQGATPQAVVPSGAWQSARPEVSGTGAGAPVGWTLVSCVVAPGFEFEGFELAPPGWSPTGAPSTRQHRDADPGDGPGPDRPASPRRGSDA